MSAPGIGKPPHLSLPDFDAVTRLPKPIKAVVYLIGLSVLTVAGLIVLAATTLVIGQLSGVFDVFSMLG
ncbi:hypothetical protein IQ251_09035 [Saccharopolyspora sp. HNM0983]|uniref:Uncharacterized protein n=1 Tax=Saccharopolyspora montiporae TaxID=2781240 RepID=A0A929BAS4_9PSEU|nr:hypothetical protein [Saccharopolyspora sp. HNM0983]MBE9374591.1 hypothetical protein [Saccharopolyspora sp. HNM0983]